MKIKNITIAGVAFLVMSCSAQDLRDVIVSHTDDQGILQLFRMKEDGSNSFQLTHSETGCRMPSVSPNGKHLIYVEKVGHSLAIMLSTINGKNSRVLINNGINLYPSWGSDSKHIVWMKSLTGTKLQDPVSNSQIHIMDISTKNTRRMFSDPVQTKFSNGMPSLSPNGNKVAFVSDRSGILRIWVSNVDGSKARQISIPPFEKHEKLDLAIEQKVPAWSPDGQWIAHWEGVEMIHMSQFTGVKNLQRDQQISATFHVWIVSHDGKQRRRVGHGDDPTWSPDGFVTRAFPDQKIGGPRVVVKTLSGEKDLTIVPHRRNWGRFAWIPKSSHK